MIQSFLFTLTIFLSLQNVVWSQGESCMNPIIINSLPFSQSGSTQGMGNDYEGHRGCFGEQFLGEDIVYSITPAIDTCYEINLLNVDELSLIHLYDGDPLNGGVCLGYGYHSSSYGSSVSSNRMSQIPLSSGTTYYLIIHCIYSNYTSNFDLSVEYSSQCSQCNDGIQNGLETGVDCGSVNCPDCPCVTHSIASIPFTDTNSTCSSGNNYQPGVNVDFGSNELYTSDFVYKYISNSDQYLNFNFHFPSLGKTAMYLFDGCPSSSSSVCIDSITKTNPIDNDVSYVRRLKIGEEIYILICGGRNSSSPPSISPCIETFHFELTEFTPTVQDCLGAVNVCQDIYYESLGPIGTGNLPYELGGISCLGQERNSAWYTYNVQQSGELCFTIDPDNPSADYDWSLFNISKYSCNDIFQWSDSMLVSCNFSPNLGSNGLTGLSNQSNGSQFFPCVNVQQGEVFAVLVSSFSDNLGGYTLNFTESTADINDTLFPSIDLIQANSSGDTIHLQFSEWIRCDALDINNLNISGASSSITEVVSERCNSGASIEQYFDLVVTPALQPGSYNFTIDSTGLVIYDICGNPLKSNSYSNGFNVGFDVPVSELDNIKFSLHPNPAKENVVVETNFPNPFNLRITDISGMPLISTQNDIGRSIIDISSLSSGIYIIYLESNGNIGAMKLLVD